ncbi:MAG: CDP-alcohol phosphatidyltransferase family protein [Thermoprotei archaeon]
MLNRIKPFVTGAFEAAAKVFAKLGFTPNWVTVMGLVLTVLAAAAVTLHLFLEAALLLVLGALFDGLDGALARLTGTQSVFGGVLDSVADRYGDALIIGSIWLTMHLPALVGFTALIGSLITSYTRARLEAAGSSSVSSVGIMERPERLILILVSLLFIQIALYVFVIIALLSNFTVIQRLVYGRAKLGGGSSQPLKS